MKKNNKLGGIALILAVLLMVTRMVPIFSSGAIAPQDFPPATIEATASLATTAQTHWEISHLMLLAALTLFLISFQTFYSELVERGQQALGRPFIISSGLGLSSFAIAGVMDGYTLPAVANRLGLLANLSDDLALTLIAYSHEMALTFFGHAQTGVVLGVGFLGIALWRAELHSRLLALSGVGVSAIALLGFAGGVFGPQWRTIETAGPMMLLYLLWLLALGIATVRGAWDRREASFEPQVTGNTA